MQFLPFLLIIVVFWFFLIRPQMKRQRQAQQMQAELTPGTKVMLTSGIFGTIAEITDDYTLVEIAEGVRIKVIRAAIGRVLPDDFGQASSESADGGDAAGVAAADAAEEEPVAVEAPEAVEEND